MRTRRHRSQSASRRTRAAKRSQSGSSYNATGLRAHLRRYRRRLSGEGQSHHEAGGAGEELERFDRSTTYGDDARLWDEDHEFRVDWDDEEDDYTRADDYSRTDYGPHGYFDYEPSRRSMRVHK